MLDSDQVDKKPEREQDIYQRIRLLGSGSFGKAFLVREIKTEHLYVIKQINMVDLDTGEQEKAHREAKLLEVLDHPNIIKFKEVYTTSKQRLNIVMEYADGGDLSMRIQQAKTKNQYFDENLILNWFTQICLGLKHLHDRKIIHRDLKGQNIFLTEDNCVKIGDLGVARFLEHTVAKARTVVGSPYYLSPQIIENKPYSFKSDIWSLGALLFEMCSLVPPFTANNLQFLALKIVKGSYANIPPQYSQDLRALIRSMLNTNQNGRPTISQILASPIINRRIRSLLTESQNINEFSHTVLHKYNPLKKQLENKLRPPPNLMQIQQQQVVDNLSNLTSNKSGRINLQPTVEAKPRTPYSYGKNAPPLRKKPAPLPKRSKQLQSGQGETQNLAELIQIKATPLQQFNNVKIIPKVTSPNPIRKRPESCKINSEANKAQCNRNATAALFNKRKSIDTGKQAKKEEETEEKQPKSNCSIPGVKINQLTVQKGLISDKSPNFSSKPNLQMREAAGKNVIRQSEIRPSKNILTKPNKALNKNNTKPKQKQKKEIKLQMVSQQQKEKQRQIKPKKNIKKASKKPKPQQKKEEVIQQQKCNDASDQKYENEQFETYEQLQNSEEVSFELSNSGNSEHRKTSEHGKQGDYKKVLQQLELINKLVQEANGKVDELPMIGSQIPEILQASAQIREDDDDLQSQLGRLTAFGNLKATETGVNFACLRDQSQLQNLRIALQELFGIENIIKAYQYVSMIISDKGLDFNEQQIIKQLLIECLTIQEQVLRKHFRLIVTVITLENQLQQF